MLLAAVTLLATFSVSAQPGFGVAEKINNDWHFHLGDIDVNKDLDQVSKAWKTVQLPHDWSVKQIYSPTSASATGYLPGGIGWYQKKLNISKDDRGKKLYLYFEGVYNRSEVFLNGKSLGKRPNG